MIEPKGSARRWTAAALLTVLITQTACYSLAPGPEPAAPATRVVARLTPAGSSAVAPRLGAGVAELEGTVVSAGQSGLLLGVTRVGRESGASDYMGRELLELPPGAVAGLREKRLNTGRSSLVGAALVAGALLVARAFGGVGGGDDGPGGGTTPPN